MNPLGIIQWAWNALPWYVQAGAIGYVAFTSIGGTLSVYNFTKSFAGKWAIPAMASLIIPLGLWVWSWMQKPDRADKGGKPLPGADDFFGEFQGDGKDALIPKREKLPKKRKFPPFN